MPVIRDPTPSETAHYVAAITSRNEELFMQLFKLYPGVLWGEVSRTILTQEDREWTTATLQKHRENDDYDEFGY